VTVTVVAGAILWRSADGLQDVHARAGEQVVAHIGSVELRPAATASEEKLARENETLRKQVAELARKNEQLEARVALVSSASIVGERPVAATPGESAPSNKAAQAPSVVRIRGGTPRQQEALAKVTNWKELAEACRDLGPIIKQVIDAQAKGEQIPSDTLKKLVDANGKLQGLAAAVNGHFPTHTPGNGEYTHPYVLGNLMAKQLELAGLPLDDGQVDAIAQIGADFDARYATLQAGYGDSTLLLEKIE